VTVASANAVGDTLLTEATPDALDSAVGELTEKQTAETKAATDAALAKSGS
jgi:hypothetical protein